MCFFRAGIVCTLESGRTFSSARRALSKVVRTTRTWIFSCEHEAQSLGRWLSQQLKEMPQSRSLSPLPSAVLGCGFVLRQKESNMKRSPQERHTPGNVPREERHIWNEETFHTLLCGVFLHQDVLALDFLEMFFIEKSQPFKNISADINQVVFHCNESGSSPRQTTQVLHRCPKERGNGNELHFQVAVILFGQEQSSLRVKGLASNYQNIPPQFNLSWSWNPRNMKSFFLKKERNSC